MADSKDKKTENEAVENAGVDASSSQAAGEASAPASAEAAAAEKKAPAKKPAAKKPAAATKKPAAKKAPAKKADEKAEAAEEKTPAKKAPAKKPAAKKPAPKPVAAEPTYVRATARYVRSAPRKARLVVDHIRGESVEDARLFLQFTARHVGRDVAKVLESAVANAEHNHELDGESLHVVKAYVDEGPTLKRWRPRAKGRATQILKRTSHITVVVSDVPAKDLAKRANASGKSAQNRKAAA